MDHMFAAYGPGFLALVIVVQLLEKLLPKFMGNRQDDTQRELARSVDKLAGVLERMEKSNEKALDEVRDTQQKTLETLISVKGDCGEILRRVSA